MDQQRPKATAQCFLLSVARPDTGSAFFELRYSADTRPFHLAIRPARHQIAVNALTNGFWGVETVHDLPVDWDPSGPILITREGQTIAVMADRLSVSVTLGSDALQADWPKPHTHGIAFDTIPPSRAPTIAWAPTGPNFGPSFGPSIASIPLSGGGHLPVPPSPPFDAVAVLADIVAHDASWLVDLAASEPDKIPHSPSSVAERLVQAYWLGNDAPAPALDLAPDLAPVTPPARPRPARVPGLDIIVALYNQQTFVVDCIASLLAQTPATVRILVIDDGSTDASVRMLQPFGPSPDGRLQILTKPNGGCASARNHGLLMSDRTHIAFADADDLAEPGFYPALFRVAQATGADFVNGGFDVYRPEASPQRIPHPFDRALEATLTPTLIDGETALRVDPARLAAGQPAIWRSVYSRAFLTRADLSFPESIPAFDDFQFHMRCMARARNAWFVPGRKYLYRQHPAQDIHQGDARHFGNLAMCTTLIRDLGTANPDALTANLATMLDVLGWSLRQMPPTLSGAFLTATAQLTAAVSRGLGPDATPEAVALVNHPDFRCALDAELARIAAVAPDAPWLETEPGLSHPNTVQMALALTGRGL